MWLKRKFTLGVRGKAGGVKIAKSLSEVETYANELLGKQLVTSNWARGQRGQTFIYRRRMRYPKRILCWFCY